VESLRDSVREGATFATALSVSPLDIPPVVIGMLRAGEMGTGLAPAVRRAADLTEQSAATRAAVRNALAYPVILAVAGSASIALLVGVVLPKFAVILGDLGQHIPRTTQMVLDFSNTARRSAIPLCITATGVVVLWHLWTSTPAGRLRWHRLLLQLPIVGHVRRSAAAARAASAMSSLLESGVPVAPALIHASHASGDAAIEAAILDARKLVTRGERVSRAMEEAGATTPTIVRLLRAGEESGRLADMFAHAATIEQQRTDRIVRSAVRLLEPALILAFGGVVAFVAAALLQAVYSVRPG
jgi:type II secretory pathway component PulF